MYYEVFICILLATHLNIVSDFSTQEGYYQGCNRGDDRPKGGDDFWEKSQFLGRKYWKILNFGAAGTKIFENISLLAENHEF